MAPDFFVFGSRFMQNGPRARFCGSLVLSCKLKSVFGVNVRTSVILLVHDQISAGVVFLRSVLGINIFLCFGLDSLSNLTMLPFGSLVPFIDRSGISYILLVGWVILVPPALPPLAIWIVGKFESDSFFCLSKTYYIK